MTSFLFRNFLSEQMSTPRFLNHSSTHHTFNGAHVIVNVIKSSSLAFVACLMYKHDYLCLPLLNTQNKFSI